MDIPKLMFACILLASTMLAGPALADGVIPALVPPFGTTAGTVATGPSAGLSVQSSPYNAACNGTTDDGAAINAALISGARLVMLPITGCRSSATIVVPPGVTLEGTSFAPGNLYSGSAIVCDLGVSPCVSASGGNGHAPLEKLTVARALGTPASTAIGILISGEYNVVLTDVMSYNHGACYKFVAQPTAGTGLGATLTRGYSGKCLDVHIDINSWPELRVQNGRFGMNGGGDYAANAFIRIEGGTGGTAAGPNTIVADDAQFNQGSSSVSHFVEFVNLGPAGIPSIDATDFKFHGLHVENVSGADFFSDATWNVINRLNISDGSFNDPSTPFFALNAATQPSVINVANNQIFGTFSLSYAASSGASINALSLKNNLIQGAVTLTGPATGGGTATVSGNSYNGGITLAGSWGAIALGPDTFISGGLTTTASGGVVINEPSLFTTPAPITAAGTNSITMAGSASGNPTITSSSAGMTLRTKNGPHIALVDNATQTTNIPLQIQGGTAGTNAASISLPSASGLGLNINTPNTINLQQSGSTVLAVQSNALVSGKPFVFPHYTVSQLPTCNTAAYGLQYSEVVVTDAQLSTSLGSGGGSAVAKVMCIGTTWTPAM